jgi:four helix bundle protein
MPIMTKPQIAMTKQAPMPKVPVTVPVYDLAPRTARFAHDCRQFIRELPKDICNIEDCKQLARSSGSVAANYIEADEALSKKDFVMRIKICRKEAKESRLWLGLLRVADGHEELRQRLQEESYQLVKIFNAIIERSK